MERNIFEVGQSSRKPRGRRRVLTVDFMRIEGTVHDQPLSAFEREVRQKLAASPSPIDVLIQREGEAQREEDIRELLQSVRFTPQQKLCYQLIFTEGRSVREAALMMRVSDARICRMVEMIKMTLRRTAEKIKMGRLIFGDNAKNHLTDYEQRLSDLRFRQGLSVRQIALVLGISKPTVYRHVKLILAKILTED